MIFIFACIVVFILLIHSRHGNSEACCLITAAAMAIGTLVYLLVSAFDSRISETTKTYYSHGYFILVLLTGFTFGAELMSSFLNNRPKNQGILTLGACALLAIVHLL